MGEIFKTISEGVRFGADVVTLALGIVAIWSLIFHKKKLALLFKVLVGTFLNERVKRVRETLGKLESLSFDTKEDRREIFALLGQVSGQVKPLITAKNGLTGIHQEIVEVLAKTTPLTEATKRKIVFELHGRLDSVSFAETQNLID